MKLKDILARELKAWPTDAIHDHCVQSDETTRVYFGGPHAEIFLSERADETVGVKVSRAEWQAAVEALKAEQESAPAIDWSKQPEEFPLWLEGTTEENRKHSGWYRKDGEVFTGEDTGQWRASREGEFFTVHRKPVNQPVVAEPAAELKWPDGATHYVPPQEKNENGVFYLVVNDDAVYAWALLKSGIDNGGRVYGESKRHQLPAAILRPTERAIEWDGVGLPPVGIECEFNNYEPHPIDVEMKWSRVRIVAHDTQGLNMFAVFASVSGYHGNSNPKCFRPIRTKEQIAAEERMAAAYAMCAIAPSLSNVDAVALYDAFYRKQVAE